MDGEAVKMEKKPGTQTCRGLWLLKGLYYFALNEMKRFGMIIGRGMIRFDKRINWTTLAFTWRKRRKHRIRLWHLHNIPAREDEGGKKWVTLWTH